MIKYRTVKRTLDIFISYLGLILAYIPMLIISLSIIIFDGRPVIFKQKRIGKDGKPFICYKFRTMRNDAPHNLSTNEFTCSNNYVTKTGSFLRRTSLDELPQLFNVLSGDMSIIGPRPLIPEEKELHKYRTLTGVYNIRPGITGLAQICGRDRLSDNRKLDCDRIYANNLSFRSDSKILLCTLRKIIECDGIKGNYDT